MIFPSQTRKESMALTFAELDKVSYPIICEVGRMRNVCAGESDGHSTFAFLNYVNLLGGRLISIDIDFQTQVVCDQVCLKSGIDDSRLTYINTNAFQVFFNQYYESNHFDLLYLDGWDLSDPDSARQHLLCFLLAYPTIKPSGLVLIDDTGYPSLGKGKLVIPAATLMGWTVLHQGFQTLIRKPA